MTLQPDFPIPQFDAKKQAGTKCTGLFFLIF